MRLAPVQCPRVIVSVLVLTALTRAPSHDSRPFSSPRVPKAKPYSVRRQTPMLMPKLLQVTTLPL